MSDADGASNAPTNRIVKPLTQGENMKKICLTMLTLALVALLATPASAQDKKNYRITNNSGAAAKDLHVTFGGTGGNLNVSMLAPPFSCEDPTISVTGGDTANMVWLSECFRNKDVCILRAQTTAGPLSVVSGEWTYAAGAPIALNVGTDVFETEVPTVGQWGLIILTLLLLTAATLIFARRRTVPAAA
jgi:hypothetical protein